MELVDQESMHHLIKLDKQNLKDLMKKEPCRRGNRISSSASETSCLHSWASGSVSQIECEHEAAMATSAAEANSRPGLQKSVSVNIPASRNGVKSDHSDLSDFDLSAPDANGNFLFYDGSQCSPVPVWTEKPKAPKKSEEYNRLTKSAGSFNNKPMSENDKVVRPKETPGASLDHEDSVLNQILGEMSVDSKSRKQRLKERRAQRSSPHTDTDDSDNDVHVRISRKPWRRRLEKARLHREQDSDDMSHLSRTGLVSGADIVPSPANNHSKPLPGRESSKDKPATPLHHPMGIRQWEPGKPVLPAVQAPVARLPSKRAPVGSHANKNSQKEPIKFDPFIHFMANIHSESETESENEHMDRMFGLVPGLPRPRRVFPRQPAPAPNQEDSDDFIPAGNDPMVFFNRIQQLNDDEDSEDEDLPVPQEINIPKMEKSQPGKHLGQLTSLPDQRKTPMEDLMSLLAGGKPDGGIPQSQQSKPGPRDRPPKPAENEPSVDSASRPGNEDPGLENFSESRMVQVMLEHETTKALSNRDPRSAQGMNTIIILDISESMAGQAFVEATHFLNHFLSGLEQMQFEYNLEENVALVTVSETAQVLQHFTTNYKLIRTAFGSQVAAGPARLHMGLITPAALLSPGPDDNRGGILTLERHIVCPRVILISDGHLSYETESMEQAARSEDPRIRVMETVCSNILERVAGITLCRLYCVPVGDCRQELLEELAIKTAGRLYQFTEAELASRAHLHHNVVGKLRSSGSEEPSRETISEMLETLTGCADDTEVDAVLQLWKEGEPDLVARDQTVAEEIRKPLGLVKAQRPGPARPIPLLGKPGGAQGQGLAGPGAPVGHPLPPPGGPAGNHPRMGAGLFPWMAPNPAPLPLQPLGGDRPRPPLGEAAIVRPPPEGGAARLMEMFGELLGDGSGDNHQRPQPGGLFGMVGLAGLLGGAGPLNPPREELEDINQIMWRGLQRQRENVRNAENNNKAPGGSTKSGTEKGDCNTLKDPDEMQLSDDSGESDTNGDSGVEKLDDRPAFPLRELLPPVPFDFDMPPIPMVVRDLAAENQKNEEDKLKEHGEKMEEEDDEVKPERPVARIRDADEGLDLPPDLQEEVRRGEFILGPRANFEYWQSKMMNLSDTDSDDLSSDINDQLDDDELAGILEPLPRLDPEHPLFGLRGAYSPSSDSDDGRLFGFMPLPPAAAARLEQAPEPVKKGEE